MTKWNRLQPDGLHMAVHHILTEGGATLVPGAYRKADHTEGYYVALHGYETQVELTGCRVKDGATVLRELALYDETWFGYGRPGWRKFIGTWVYQGWLYLDITEHVRDQARALRHGVTQQQLAIWDIAHGESIPVNGR